jgi:hypothetical protein
MSRRSRAGSRPSPHGRGGPRDAGRGPTEAGRGPGPEARRTTSVRPRSVDAPPDAMSERPADPARDLPRPDPVDAPAASRGGDRANGAEESAGGAAVPQGTQERRPSAQTVCTAAQLRRFIKSRAYVPMHELRRRFGINGSDDDVTPVPMERGTIFVGLPRQEGNLLGELLRAGEVGFELSLDPRTPIVVGVYPMRPIPRP